MAGIAFIDFDGTKISEAAFRAIFGAFVVQQEPLAPFAVVRLKAATGYATFRLRVVDEEWRGIAGLPVLFGWPDGQVEGVTAANGWAEFPMGPGAYYALPGMGPHWARLGGSGPWEQVHGIGMVAGTEHDHFDVILKQRAVDPLPQAIWHLEQARALLAEADGHIADAIGLLSGP